MCFGANRDVWRLAFHAILRQMGEFSDKVFSIVRQIPVGKVTTYGHVARLMGRPQSARYVGFALRTNPSPGIDGAIPCHRVLFKDGSLCPGFAFGGPEVQRELLEAEGVTFVDDTHVDLRLHLWNGSSDEQPLGPPEDFDWDVELGEPNSRDANTTVEC